MVFRKEALGRVVQSIRREGVDFYPPRPRSLERNAVNRHPTFRFHVARGKKSYAAPTSLANSMVRLA
jgi:hypothetical protein